MSENPFELDAEAQETMDKLYANDCLQSSEAQKSLTELENSLKAFSFLSSLLSIFRDK